MRLSPAQIYEPVSAPIHRGGQYSVVDASTDPLRSWDPQATQRIYLTRGGVRQDHQRLEESSPRVALFQARPQFRSKVVCLLGCKHCDSEVCRRGMKAILLADMNLYSTDSTPYGVQLVNDDYRTKNCFCRIRDVACLGCGNVVGYHVTQPCEPCMDACNNGHFWMFHCTEVTSVDRMNTTNNPLLWSQLPKPDKDISRVLETIR